MGYETLGHKSGMNKNIFTHIVFSIITLLSVNLSELITCFDLDNTASESDILFGVILHSQQDISTYISVLLDEAVSGT